MPLLSCDPLILVDTLGSIEVTLPPPTNLHRRPTLSIDARFHRASKPSSCAEAAPESSASRHAHSYSLHLNASPLTPSASRDPTQKTSSWQTTQQGKLNPLPLSVSSAYAPHSRITVTTTTAPSGSTVTSVTAPHSPLVAGTLLVQRNPIQAAHPSLGGKLRIIHTISKVGDMCDIVTQVRILP